MASLRDVLNHIGKPVQIEREGAVVGRVLGTVRGSTALLEAKVEPRPGDRLRFVESGQAFRVGNVEAASVRDRLDHYRAQVTPL